MERPLRIRENPCARDATIGAIHGERGKLCSEDLCEGCMTANQGGGISFNDEEWWRDEALAIVKRRRWKSVR
jgi:hypothetical protein